MKTLDLREAIPRTLAQLEEAGGSTGVAAVLRGLGVPIPPTLRLHGCPREPERAPSADELVCLGRFQLRGELGRGGMGRVLEALDPELRRSVAVKVIIEPGRVTEAQLSRFVAEARITSQLEHPNIVPVYEMGVSGDGLLYFVMKKVEGRSLREVLALLRSGHEAATAEWTLTKLLHAFIQICNAVAYAHDRGVIHRDLKPDNVMLGPFGEVLLMDWGVARLLGDRTEVVTSEVIDELTVTRTLDGATIGTPGFMSPEQALGGLQDLDGRSDVWSLGAVLYELLTLEPAYEAPNLYALVYAAATAPPVDPRTRAPRRGIPQEVAEVCLKALARERAERFATAGELAAALEAFLEGSKRKEAAREQVDAAEAAWARYCELARERRELVAREVVLDELLDPWASLEEKRLLLEVRERLSALKPLRVREFGEVLAACEQALALDTGNGAARSVLARAHYARFEEAEAAGDEQDRLYHEGRVLTYDDGHYAPLLRGTGALTLRTDPPGAEVICERYEQRGLVWPLVERRCLGVTPIEELPIEQGSYLLTLKARGKRDTRYPIHIPRGHRWDSGPAPVPLFSDADIGPDSVYVPPGPFLYGGDPGAQDPLPSSRPWLDGFFISILPVTMRGYCAFINDLLDRSPEEAWSRLPRQETGLKTRGGQYWDRPAPGARYAIPEIDRDGDRWEPDWPVFGVSWHDAQAFMRWRSERDGVAWTLPSEQWWEKAARGADGRVFPWGGGFDPTLCKMRTSRPGVPRPEPVGRFSTDVSPYGVRDLAGCNREWCGDEVWGGDPDLRPVRGAAWNSTAPFCRAATRYGMGSPIVIANLGFRSARPAAAASAAPVFPG